MKEQENRKVIVRAEPTPGDCVVQANPLVRAVYNLPPKERQMLTLLLAHIDPEAKDIPIIEMDVLDMCRVLAMDYKKNSAYLRSICRKGVRRGLSIDTPDEGWIESTWYTCTYNPKKRTISFEIPGNVKPYLIGLRRTYTSVPAGAAVRMTGKYTVRIYENIMSWKGAGKGKPVWKATLKMEDLRQMFMLGDRYDKSADFTRYIIRPAIEEINTVCEDMKITYETVVIPGSRRVDHYLFTIHQAKDGAKPVTPPTKDEEDEDSLTPEEKERLGKLIAEIKAQGEFPGFEDDNPAKRQARILKEAMARLRAEKHPKAKKKKA